MRYAVATTPLSRMIDNFLTVKDAARLVGKSPSSIRRVIYPILQNDAHPDRTHIRPGVDEAMQLRMKGESFGWRLSEELLRRDVPIEAVPEKGIREERHSDDGHGELLSMLRRELDIKNQQIIQQSELISKHVELIGGLSERLREGNILIGSLQQRLTLGDGREATTPEAKTVEPLKPKPTTATKSEKGSSPSAKAAKPKRGLLTRLFRS